MRRLLFCYILFFPLLAISQPKVAWWKPIRFTRIPMDDTITVRVPCAAVDENNVIWTGRGTWLCGWDDNKKTWERHNMKDSIAAIEIDAKGRFWLGTESQTVILFDKTTNQRKQTPLKDFKKEAHINDIAFTNNNEAWVCTTDGLCKIRESYGVLKVDIVNDLKGINIIDIEEHKGVLKVATPQGLYQFKGDTWSPELFFDKKKIWGMDNNGGDELFIAFNKGRADAVYRNNMPIGADSSKKFQFNDVLADDFGRVWGAVKEGIYGWSEVFNGWHYFHNDNSDLNITEAWVVIQDKKGAIWVGAEQGLYKIREPAIKIVEGNPNPATPTNPENPNTKTYNPNGVLPPGTAPIHLVLVLDISGSMESSITRMGVAFNNILQNLRAEDKVSIITFANKAETRIEDLPIDQTAKKQIRDVFGEFTYKGSTNIKAALTKANSVAKAHKAVGGNNRVIIVSDANFDVKGRFPTVTSMATDGLNVSIFCSQKKTKEQHKELEDFARKGRGSYFNFATGNNKSIEQAFWEELSQ
jgi:von Willebrand factor type A domain